MTDELRAKIERLRSVAPQLNAATDEASKVVQSVEAFLKGLSLGLTVQSTFGSRVTEGVEDDDEADDEADGLRSEIDDRLVYGRLGGEYRLFVRQVLTRQEADPRGYEPDWIDVRIADETPWSSCPREIKLASFAVLPDLLSALSGLAEKMASKAEATSKAVGEILGAIGGQIDQTPSRGWIAPTILKVMESSGERVFLCNACQRRFLVNPKEPPEGSYLPGAMTSYGDPYYFCPACVAKGNVAYSVSGGHVVATDDEAQEGFEDPKEPKPSATPGLDASRAELAKGRPVNVKIHPADD